MSIQPPPAPFTTANIPPKEEYERKKERKNRRCFIFKDNSESEGKTDSDMRRRTTGYKEGKQSDSALRMKGYRLMGRI